MRASDNQATTGLLILLLSLGGSVGALGWWSLARISNDPPAAVSADIGIGARTSADSGLQADALPTSRAFVAQRRAPPDSDVDLPAARMRRPGSERALREKYRSLEAAQPGHLAAHAEEWLGTERPAAEKVAWLTALHDSDPAAGTRWLEFACGLRDAATPHGVAPAVFALEFLVRLSASDAAARAALYRVACAPNSVGIELRRRAAETFAAIGDAHELDCLADTLLVESDNDLHAAVAAALDARTDAEGRLAARRWPARLHPVEIALQVKETGDDP